MRIEEMKNKVKILLEYSTKLLGFLTISREDLEKLHLRVFLKDGREFYDDEIKEITLRLKEK